MMKLFILIGYIAYAMGAYNYFASLDYAPASKCVDGADLGDYTGVKFGSVDSCYEFEGGGIKIACAADGSTYTMSVYTTADCSNTPTVFPATATNTCDVDSSNDDATKWVCSETDLEEEEEEVCFAGSETLTLESGNEITMDNVSIGDRVMVANNDGTFEFADVIALPHGKNQIEASFVELSTSTSSLKATPAHLVMAGSCDGNAMSLVRAEDVNVGDCLASTDGPVELISSRMTKSHGIYTAVTSNTDGIIVVNGFKASSFAVNHIFVNNYYNIHRVLYSFAPKLVESLANFSNYLAVMGGAIISA